MNWEAVAKPIFNLINQNIDFPWPRSQGSRDRLVRVINDILPDADAELFFPFDEKNKTVANRNIREVLGPYLRGRDRALASRLAVVVVKNWGGITRGHEVLPAWSDELGDYSRLSIDDFVAKMGTKRIASWSKLLAFAAPQTEAIYDARTAAALNCALFQLGLTTGFFMPPGRNRSIVPACQKLTQLGFKEALGYPEYLSLLRHMAPLHDQGDILAVEMMLFANAPKVAQQFTLEYGS